MNKIRLIPAFGLAILIGCSSTGPYPVEGVIVWMDGTPAKELVNSQVVFEQTGKFSSRGVVKADGTFKLTTNKQDDGAMPGEHQVLIVESRPYAKGGEGAGLAPGYLHDKYYDLKSSGLKATVIPGGNKVELKVEKLRK